MAAPRKATATKKTTKAAAAKPTTNRTPATRSARKSTAKRAPAKKTAAKKPPAKPRVVGPAGSTERVTWEELRDLDLLGTSPARTALAMAKWVDKADSPQGAAAAARELRMQMQVARNTGKPLSPPVEDDDDFEDLDGTAASVPNLAAMRARADARRSG